MKVNVILENIFIRRFLRRFLWLRMSRIVESNFSDIKEVVVNLLKISKRRKLGVIEERDLFVFDEDDVIVVLSLKESIFWGNVIG